MKRIISILLVAALMLSVLPVAFATETETETEATEYNFVFTNAAHTTTADKSTVSFTTAIHSIENTSEGYDRWGYVARYFPDTDSCCSDGSYIRVSYYRPGKQVDTAVTFSPDMEKAAAGICFELEIKKGGYYAPTLTYARHNYGPIAEIYLVPKTEIDGTITNNNLSDTIKALDAKYRVGTVDSYTGSALTMRSVYLPDNTNCYLFIVPNGESEAAHNAAQTKNINFHYFLPSGIKLTPHEKEYIGYDYDFTTVQPTGGVDVDTDGEGTDAGLPIDTNAQNATDSQNSTVGVWNNKGIYYLYNGALTRFLTDEYTYINTSNSGKWSYAGDNGRASLYINSNGIMMTTRNLADGYIALKIKVDRADTYELSFERTKLKYDALGQFSVFSASNELNLENIAASTVGGEVDFFTAEGSTYVGKVNIPTPGEYYLVVSYKGLGSCGYDSDVRGIHLKSINLKGTTLEYKENLGDEFVNVSPNNAPVAGTTTATAEVNATAVDEDNNYISVEIEEDSNSVKAPLTAGENGRYKFLYWTKGIGKNRKIVSQTETHTFDATPGNNIFIAVYRDTEKAVGESAIFYNANGDILGKAEATDGEITTLSLDKVSLPGLGKAIGWSLSGDENLYAGGEKVEVSGDMRFVASYGDSSDAIEVTTDSDVSIEIEGGKSEAAYGDLVTLSAPARRDNTKLFNYWTKNGEIVSFDREYTFCAWGNCEVRAVYSDYAPASDTVRKILIGSVTKDSETTVVAEFIGFEDAVERGIAFGITGAPASVDSINRAVMNRKDANHIAAIDDIGEGYVGYAITKDGKVYYSK